MSQRCQQETFSFTPKREDGFPVVLHIDNGPALRLSDVERLVEFTDGGVTVVSPFPLGIGVVDNKGEADAASSLRPLEHLQVAVGVSK